MYKASVFGENGKGAYFAERAFGRSYSNALEQEVSKARYGVPIRTVSVSEPYVVRKYEKGIPYEDNSKEGKSEFDGMKRLTPEAFAKSLRS